MNDSQLKPFTHANTGEVVYVDMAVLFAHWHSPAHKATLLQASAGALLPIKEDTEFVTTAKLAYLKGEEVNGT